MTFRHKIPSANALFTFEAAAKTLNFTEAGHLLNVTQPAVSKAIGLLEKTLSTQLFIRHRAGLSLTPAGEKLFRSVNLAFRSLEDSIDQISGKNQQNNHLTLSVSTAFAAHWLIPQLDSFRRDLPDIALNFELTAGEVSGIVAPCDLGLRLESEMDDNEQATQFCPEWLIAVASPDYLNRNGRLDEAKQGAKHSIVTLSEARITWETFLAVTGQSICGTSVEMTVPDYSVVIQSALNGRCAALGFASTCGHLIKEGLLVPVLPVSWQTGKSYYLVSPKPLLEPLSKPLKKNSKIHDLQKWLLDRSASCMPYLGGIHIYR
ncbi:MAG: LysR substrate-binding domain-containing protein [Arenicellales bacterium]